MSNDYESLLGDDKFADVVLVVGDTELKAHKLILTARSEVFAAMFEHATKEKQKSSVDITDVSVDVFRKMLQFIYSGSVPEMDELAVELLIVADKVWG